MKNRVWCKSMIVAVMQKHCSSSEYLPSYHTKSNNPLSNNSKWFTAIGWSGPGIRGYPELVKQFESVFPPVSGGTFPKKKDAEQDAALTALMEWRISGLKEIFENASDGE